MLRPLLSIKPQRLGLVASVCLLAACGGHAYVPAHGASVVGVGDPAACTNPQGNGHVKLTDDRLEIDEKIQFEVNAANILPQSDGLLDEVADVLKQYPQVQRVEVQGHSSGEGDARRNKTLSQQRASAVVDALTKRGVAKSRLVAKGYGAERLLVPEKSEDDRERNRRVEFLILQLDGAVGKTSTAPGGKP